ncbi:permease [Elizabethkingia ursingii]|uniref:ABC transporter permease n=1 Tax=Elizabethkingia ursingii TaxID=1756150 RepID=UPI0007510E84|nr:FtsX-like permease family protein [Elizabethkingia ursingii]KUY30484.1 permease [Elizabethkingia ursingii]MCL1665620.1 ABC transporter permease [Elizabethkingia ursingii]MDR2229997.1 ABC transporter permease [Flavobacteriaceae bacterium]OPC04688.1 permease [Elizabethkingia ursingii]
MKSTPFYIAQRYLISKKGSQAVSFITSLSAFAMMVAVAAMFIIVSVFSGLIELNKKMISDIHADLTLSPEKGKVIPNIAKVTGILSKEQEIAHFSKVIEEKAYINYKGNGEIVYLRGVDSAYTKVNPIDSTVFYGKYPSFKYSNEVIMETQLNNRLEIPVASEDDYAQILMPRPGVGLISKEADIFNKKNFFTTGVFTNSQMGSYIVAPLELSAELLGMPKNTAYSVVIKLKDPSKANEVRNRLMEKLGSGLEMKTKAEENAAFWKMINTEKLMIYLIFGLVIFITTFNLAGAIIIIQLDKKEQAKSLISMGMSMAKLRNVYFNTGILIVIFGVSVGLVVGSLICYLQQHFGFFKATAALPFPVKIEWQNYLIVAATALLFGIIISWIFSRGSKRQLRS